MPRYCVAIPKSAYRDGQLDPTYLSYGNYKRFVWARTPKSAYKICKDDILEELPKLVGNQVKVLVLSSKDHTRDGANPPWSITLTWHLE